MLRTGLRGRALGRGCSGETPSVSPPTEPSATPSSRGHGVVGDEPTLSLLPARPLPLFSDSLR